MTVQRYTFVGTNGNAPAGWTLGGRGTINIQTNKLRIVSPTTVDSWCALIFKQSIGPNVDLFTRVTPGQTWATNAFVGIGLMNDPTLDFNTGDAVNVEANGSFPSYGMFTTIAGVGAAFGSSSAQALSASASYYMRFRRVGNWIGAKMWQDTGTAQEPADWLIVGSAPALPTKVLYPMLYAYPSTTAAARTFNFDFVQIDDLVPLHRQAWGGRR